MLFSLPVYWDTRSQELWASTSELPYAQSSMLPAHREKVVSEGAKLSIALDLRNHAVQHISLLAWMSELEDFFCLGGGCKF